MYGKRCPTFNPGSEQTITAGGKSYRLGKLTVAVLREFRDYCAERAGDPFETADRYIDRVPPDVAARMIKEASDLRDQLRFFSLGAPVAQQALATEEGSARLLYLLLLTKDPKVTEDDALALAMYLAGEEMAKLLAKAQGSEKGEGAEGNVPAAEAGTPSAGETSPGG